MGVARMAQKDVKISFSGNTISVDKEKVSVHKNNDTVLWSAHGEFGIVINGQSTAATQHGSNWQVTLGPWNTVETIKYDVTAPGKTTLDPDIVVLEAPGS
jgi:hypothetical protein